MKKAIIWLLLFFLVTILCACENVSTNTPSTDKQQNHSPSEESIISTEELDDTEAFRKLIEKEYPGFLDSYIDNETGGVSVFYMTEELASDLGDYALPGLHYFAYAKTRSKFPEVALVICTIGSDYAKQKDVQVSDVTIMYYPENDKENAITWHSKDGEKGMLTDASVPITEGSAVDLPYYEIDQYIDKNTGRNIANGKGMSRPTPSESSNDGLSVEQRNALSKASSYLSHSAFSYQGLIEQLEFSGFKHDAAVFAADNCGADWFEQAEKKAESYLKYSSFSRTGLIEQLEYSGFTNEEAVHGADYALSKPTGDGLTSGQSNALNKAKSYLSHSAFSYTGLVEQLEYSGFDHEDAVFAADNCGADWNEQAVKKAQSYLEHSSFSKERLIEQLVYSGFTKEQARHGADVAFGD